MRRLALLCLMIAPLLAMGPASAQDRQPDVIVAILDDMRTSDWSAMDRTLAAANGTLFPNTISTTPVCCPARAGILTGQYAHNHGVLRMGSGPTQQRGYTAYNLNGNRQRNLAVWLDAAGYETALYGKYLNGDKGAKTPRPPGWDRWWVLDSNEYWRTVTGGKERQRTRRIYTADEMRTRTVGLLAATNRPVFAYLGFVAPHEPPIAAPRHHGCSTATIDWDAPSRGGDLAGKPRHMQRPPLTAKERAAVDQLERKRPCSLEAVDEALAAIIAAQAKRDRPLVLIVASDQGFLMGEHRWVGKTVPYDGVIRTPMLVRATGLAPGTDDRLVALHDIAPTVADAADVSIPVAVDGRSLLDPWQRERILIEWFGVDVPRAKEGQLIRQVETPYRAIRTRDTLYVEYATGETERIDYRDDPDELGGLTAQSERDADMAAMIEALRSCSAETCWEAES